MRAQIFSLGLFVLTAASAAFADTADNVAAYDAILSTVEPDQTTVALGDMVLPVETVRRWRNKLAGVPTTSSASQTGVTPWPGGIVNYVFDASVNAAHRTATRDAMGEWATFANLTFIEGAAANYILIKEVAGLGGGMAAVGRTGPAQQFDIGPSAWNRGTLLHELGHTLGLIHEHQRGEPGVNNRNNFVTIGAEVASNGNFILIPSTSNGPYDFLSVMHYARDTFAPFGVDDIIPKTGYTQFIDIMGKNPDRVLSRGDRNGIALMYSPAPTLTTVVTNTKDSGVGSLRAAIYKAFDIVTDTPGATPTITFAIPTSDPNYSAVTGVFTIQPTDRMTAPGSGTTIDATTLPNTNASGPEVVLSGALQPSPEYYTPGLRLSAANVTVKGLVIQGFSTQGILITGTAATGDTVSGCYIGTNSAGTAAAANTSAGIEINGGAAGNTIGGTTAAARNVISGNLAQGMFIRGAGTTGNFVRGNYLGLNAAGTSSLANGFSGVEIGENASANTIGGTAAGAGNVLSGNTYQGIYINGTNGHTVAGNFIGTNAAGSAAIANGTPATRAAGVFISGANNTVGGPTASARNILSGNTAQGVAIAGANATGNVVLGNFAGTDATGSVAVANFYGGVQIYGGAANNTVGGTAAGAGNVLSGNSAQGVSISEAGSTGNVVAGNFIGTNPAGTSAIANAYSGVGIFNGATGNTIGGTAAGAGNLISGNSSQGLVISDTGTNNNVVLGNFIGTNATGGASLANGFSGVQISGGAQNNTIGGTTAPARNIISGNLNQGVSLYGTGTSGNRVLGNYIGINSAGTSRIPNSFPGVEIFNAANSNVIGGTSPGAGNVISSNGYRQVSLENAGTNNNVVAGNFIGLNAAGTSAIAPLVNPGAGITIFGGAQNNTIGGTSGGRNFICGNPGAGVTISDSGTNANVIVGNSIGTTPAGAAVANTGEGISIYLGAQGSIIGGITPGAANLISGNSGPGIAIYDIGTTGHRISGNSITANVGLGIDFGYNGVTANDLGDADTGPNNLQNFPVLNSAAVGVGTTISWTLNSTANAAFRVEFFANATNDGQGQTFLGAVNVNTVGTGNPAVTPISTTLPAVVPANYYITATATDASGNTSEFSAHRQVSFIDSEPDGLPDSYELANWPGIGTTTGAADSDGDGMTNVQEFRAGTNPRDPLSVFRLAPPVTVSADKTLSLANFAGRTYRIDYADILATPTPWRILADQIPGTGSAITITDPGAAALPQRYYRAVVEP